MLKARSPNQLFFSSCLGLWLDWIKDEVSLAISEEEKKRVLDLYEKATVDYLCMLNLKDNRRPKVYMSFLTHINALFQTSVAAITIWKSYVDYAIEEHLESMEDPDEEPVLTEDEVRTICHRAIKFTEYHIPESHTIWNAWMDFELQQLESQVRNEAMYHIHSVYRCREKGVSTD